MSIISGIMDSNHLEEEHGESAGAVSPSARESSATKSTAAGRQTLEEGISDNELQLQMEAWREAANDRPL